MGVVVRRVVYILCAWTICVQASQEGSISSPQPGDVKVWREDSLKLYNPLAPTLASILLPGAGQFYTRHYVKGTFFAALAGIFGAAAYSWGSIGTMRETEEKFFVQRAYDAATPLDSASYMESSYLVRQDAVEAHLTKYDFISWSVGAYLFNVLDALGGSNVFRNTDERNPGIAGLLAAVPALGLGQLYNGSLSKAGMVMMGQTSLGIMAYNSHRLIERAEANYIRLNAATADSLTMEVARDYSGEWSGARNRAFINRNMYSWYSIFFYFYSIFDAVVDAYLHDYPEKMKIEPDLVSDGKQMHFTLKTLF